jgi:SAM-dependent methyltransferase
MIQAVRPGGWLLLEEVDFFPVHASSNADYRLFMSALVNTVVSASGRDCFWARALPAMVAERGLANVTGEGGFSLLQGGGEVAEFFALTAEQMRVRLLESQAIDEAGLDRALALLADPAFWAFGGGEVAIFGRRPEASFRTAARLFRQISPGKDETSMSAGNQYNDQIRADSYAKLGITNGYYLAYRDLPNLISKYRLSGLALDYGCGTGRSTRFLRDHGFSTIGVDIAEAMIMKARDLDPQGDYHVIEPGDLRNFPATAFDFVLSNMPFDNIPTMSEKVRTLLEIARVLKPGGTKILVAASHDLYLKEWVSWSSADFPENRLAKAGDPVKVAITDLGDRRIVEDTLWTEDAYRETFKSTPLQLLEILRPIVRSHDPYQCEWVSERTHAPFVIFVLRKPHGPAL